MALIFKSCGKDCQDCGNWRSRQGFCLNGKQMPQMWICIVDGLAHENPRPRLSGSRTRQSHADDENAFRTNTGGFPIEIRHETCQIDIDCEIHSKVILKLLQMTPVDGFSIRFHALPMLSGTTKRDWNTLRKLQPN